MSSTPELPFPPDPELQLRSTNQKIAKLATASPCCDIQATFTHTAHLATEALNVATELKRMPGIEADQMRLVIQFWYSLADLARTAALACVGGSQTLAEATVAFLFLQTSCARKPVAAEVSHPVKKERVAGQ